MLSGRRERIFRSTSARLAALYAVLLLASFLVAGVLVWLATRSAAEGEIRRRVAVEMEAIQQEWRTVGAAGALTAIRLREGQPGALEYCVWDVDDRVQECALDIAMPVLGWNRLRLADPASSWENHDVLLLAQQTPAGGVLAVADSLQQAEHSRAVLVNTILWVGSLALALALAAGFIVARGALRRVDELSHTLALAGAGDLSARAPESPVGDDIDAIARGVNQMLARIDSLVGNIRRVSTDIAHDLRTPLAHVRQKLETAASSTDPGATQEAIRLAQEKIDEILRTFAAMLRLSEIEAGAARSRFGELDLGSLIERVSDAYRPDIEAAGQTLEVDLDEAAPIPGDDDLIAQALANLIENAMRHAGGAAVIVVRLRSRPTETRLEVADNGPGVPADDRARVLEPYVRLDRSRTTPGAGLGLAIVAAIARLHGAELVLENAAPGLRAVLVWRTL